MTNQVDGQIIGRKLQYVEINDSDFEKFKVERGDILFNRTNSLDLVGRTAIFDIEGEFVFASYLIRLRTDEKQLNPFFLNCYFNTDEIHARLKIDRHARSEPKQHQCDSAERLSRSQREFG